MTFDLRSHKVFVGFYNVDYWFVNVKSNLNVESVLLSLSTY